MSAGLSAEQKKKAKAPLLFSALKARLIGVILPHLNGDPNILEEVYDRRMAFKSFKFLFPFPLMCLVLVRPFASPSRPKSVHREGGEIETPKTQISSVFRVSTGTC